jgi:hypothetical protein
MGLKLGFQALSAENLLLAITDLLSNGYDGLYTGVTRQVLLPSTLTSLSVSEVTDSTTSCFLGLYACPATDGDVVAIFLTVNFPLITPGTPCRYGPPGPIFLQAAEG